MSRNLLTSGIEYLHNTDNVKIAHLIRLELAESTPESPVYTYMTDSPKTVYSGGVSYLGGRVLSISSIEQTTGLSSYKLTVQVAGELQEELDRALLEGSTTKSYLNKEILVTKAYFDDNFNIIPLSASTNGPLEIFRGLITDISVREDVSRGSSTVTWSCANHFADFERVNGRLTDDKTHRALVMGEPTNAAKRAEYQKDRGFYHSVGAVNVLAQYQSIEKRYRMKKKRSGGFGGLIGMKSYSLEEYDAVVTKEVDLAINLSAKYIPVVYGVRKVPGIPIFADTLKNDPSKVYVAYAVCEGEIEAILDIIIDDQPIICYNEEDKEARVCLGSQLNGDTLGVARVWNGSTYVDPIATDRPKGSYHGRQYELRDQNGLIEFWCYHGKKNQHYKAGVSPSIPGMANDTEAPIDTHPLYKVAHTTKFFRQDSSDNGDIYWGKDFLLLDTAYVVMCFHLSDINGGRTDIPSIEFVVEGKKINTYKNGVNNPVVVENSKNFAWQLLDYITSKTYGGNIPITQINLDSFYQSALVMDQIDTSYDASWVRNWRYIGWKAQDNSNRQLLQGNTYLPTEDRVFNNVEGILTQFYGTLNLLSDRYHLSVESEYSPIADINYLDCIGGIEVKDLSGRLKWNTISAGIEDPGIGWATNQVVFFDAEYLDADKRVEKKGNLKFEHITNYYCARTLVERTLDRSRFSRSVNITVGYEYVYLFPNCVVSFSYPRFGWDKKEFIIGSMTIRPEGLIDLTLIEYESTIFPPSPQEDAGNTIPPITPAVKPPRNFRFQANEDPVGNPTYNGKLEWNNSLTSNVLYYELRYVGPVSVIAEPIVIFANPEGLEVPPTYYAYDLENLQPGAYVFYLRAVTTRGEVSRDEILNIPSLAGPDFISDVTGFRVVNLEPDTGGSQFFGSSVLLEWDPNQDPDLLGYLLEVVIDGSVIRSDLVGLTTSYEYTRDMNKGDYAAANGNNVGIYRRLTFRIKARDSNGALSAQWSTIN